LPIFLKLLTLLICILGGLFGYYIRNVNLFFFNKSLNFYTLRFFFGRMWFIPIISTMGVIKFPLKLGKKSYEIFDQG
jgi:NADH-ubiquinone oxidoreductase chain 5